ncbi:hypothetical protein UA08_07408 [Talaromyces atroroseus]|uniref:Uncharacterized protein n=1 Tax=Talaromyces atroroseus TaxID=1441469 RepID=A0A225AQN2_TALAT|nr:hypothetical protein UA08_07408 [Talaromyces atroroseus]OKL57236.1 hypothetical protein UA08_07408 [Talaromyces atroroseus]
MDAAKQVTNSPSQHTEAHRQHLYNNLPVEERGKKSYYEWVREAYQEQYEKWVPWLEDQYLKWFGNGDNKASYATKDTLNKSKVSGIPQVDQLQDDAHNLLGNQLGENGLAAPVGNIASKEGVNRMERQGKDDKGTYGGPAAGYTDSILNKAKSGAQYVGTSLSDGAKSTGSYMGLGEGSQKSQ